MLRSLCSHLLNLLCSVCSLTLRILKRLAKDLNRLHMCAGWSEPLLVTHTTLLEIPCPGSIIRKAKNLFFSRNPTFFRPIKITFLGHLRILFLFLGYYYWFVCLSFRKRNLKYIETFSEIKLFSAWIKKICFKLGDMGSTYCFVQL